MKYLLAFVVVFAFGCKSNNIFNRGVCGLSYMEKNGIRSFSKEDTLQEEREKFFGEWELAFYDFHKMDWPYDSSIRKEDLNFVFNFGEDSITRVKTNKEGDSLVVKGTWEFVDSVFYRSKHILIQDYWTKNMYFIDKVNKDELILNASSFDDVTLEGLDRYTFYFRKKGSSDAFKLTETERLLEGEWKCNLDINDMLWNKDSIVLFRYLIVNSKDTLVNQNTFFENYSNYGRLEIKVDYTNDVNRIKFETIEEYDTCYDLIDLPTGSYSNWAHTFYSDFHNFEIIDRELKISMYSERIITYKIIFLNQEKLVLKKVE